MQVLIKTNKPDKFLPIKHKYEIVSKNTFDSIITIPVCLTNELYRIFHLASERDEIEVINKVGRACKPCYENLAVVYLNTGMAYFVKSLREEAIKKELLMRYSTELRYGVTNHEHWVGLSDTSFEKACKYIGVNI